MAFSFWDPGGCGCTAPAPNATVDTKWCGCVAPGTITVTIRSGPCPGGAVAASGVADGTGVFATHLAAGTYCVSATTTAAGYISTPRAFTVPGTGGVATSATLGPSQLTISDATLGVSVTAFPNTIGPTGGTADPTLYWGSTSYDVAATACCPAATVTVWLSFSCTDPILGGPVVSVQTTSDFSGPGEYQCPLPDGSIPASATRPLTGSLCYPLSLSTGTVTIPDLMDVDGISAMAGLYGVCLDGEGTPTPDGVTTVNTVTQ